MKKLKSGWNKVFHFFNNRYRLVFTVFVVWLLFFDSYNVFEVYRMRRSLGLLKAEMEYYQQETAKLNVEKEELLTDTRHLERFARERYMMKRDNEDIFIFEEK